MPGPDLNIDNYDLADILKLFKLEMDFGERELKNAKRVVLKMHPDKSGLDKEYFIFFSRAYKLLYTLHQFRNGSDSKTHKTAYDASEFISEDSSANRELIERFSKVSDKPFHEWFNELFEKNNLGTLAKSDGYGEWLRSEEDCSSVKLGSMRDVNEHIDKRKKELGALVVNSEVGDMSTTGGSNLVDGEVKHYDSGMFSNLQYDDLRRAHQESVIAVSEEQNVRRSFRDINELRTSRQAQSSAPLSEEESKRYLENKERATSATAAHRAYQLAREVERNKAKERDWWGHLKRLT